MQYITTYFQIEKKHVSRCRDLTKVDFSRNKTRFHQQIILYVFLPQNRSCGKANHKPTIWGWLMHVYAMLMQPICGGWIGWIIASFSTLPTRICNGLATFHRSSGFRLTNLSLCSCCSGDSSPSWVNRGINCGGVFLSGNWKWPTHPNTRLEISERVCYHVIQRN